MGSDNLKDLDYENMKMYLKGMILEAERWGRTG